MILYTFQNLDVLRNLCHSKEKKVLADPDYIKKEFLRYSDEEKDPYTASKIFDSSFNPAYKWMSKKLNEKVSYPCSHIKENDRYPFWAYSKFDGITKSGRPDFRFSQYRDQMNKYKSVLITLDIPDDFVLLSDFDAWHWVLNKWYLGYEYQLNNFLKIYSKESGKKQCKWFEYDKLSDELKRTIEESWDHVFNLKLMPKMLHFKKCQQIVQANFWDIKLENIQSVLVKKDNKIIEVSPDKLDKILDI